MELPRAIDFSGAEGTWNYTHGTIANFFISILFSILYPLFFLFLLFVVILYFIFIFFLYFILATQGSIFATRGLLYIKYEAGPQLCQSQV